MYNSIQGKEIILTLDHYDYVNEGVQWFNETGGDENPFSDFTEEELDLPLDPPLKTMRLELPDCDEEGYVSKYVTLEKDTFITYKDLFVTISQHFIEMELGDHRYILLRLDDNTKLQVLRRVI